MEGGGLGKRVGKGGEGTGQGDLGWEGWGEGEYAGIVRKVGHG